MNLASLLSLPDHFRVIENNGYAYSTPVSEQFRPGTEIWQRGPPALWHRGASWSMPPM